MKYRNKIWIAFLVFIPSFSCNKNYLDQDALGPLDESKITNKKGVDQLLIGAYAMLDGVSIDPQNNNYLSQYGNAPSNWIYGSISGSEAYTGSDQTDQPDIRNIEKFKPLATNYYFDDKWKAIYAGVARTNTVLRVMKKASDINDEDKKRIGAEAKFLRAFFHFEAIKIWNKVPFVDETITYDAGNYHLGNDTLIWHAIESDFKFAMENLPATQPEIGRANSYAAKAFLAKAYMFEHRYSDAKPLLQDLISNGTTAGGLKYGLVKHYADNYNAETKNNEEAVFSVQMSVNDGADATFPDGSISGGFNGNLSDELNFPGGENSVTPCCGFFQPSQWLVNHFKTDPVTGLPDLDSFNDTDVKNDQGIESSDPFTPYAGTLDPRLDWTIGRREIPYLDWGNHPGQDWARNQNYSGPYSPKKNVFYKAQAAIYSYNGWAPMASAININLIRFADILLWAAEVEIETGNPDNAREYVNTIRARAGDSTGWVHTYVDVSDPSKGNTDIPAANYKIGLYTQPWSDIDFARKAVRYERELELAMEGHRFFDLVRWEIADLEINTYLQKEQTLRSYMIGATFTKGVNEYYPIPQRQIDLSAGQDGIPKLKQNPGY